MTRHTDFQHQAELASWISRSAPFNAFITVTLKQGLLDDTFRGKINPIQRADCSRTAWLLRDRLTQKLLGSKRRKLGEKLPYAAFVEGDGFIRFHLHIVTVQPADVHPIAFRGAVHSIAHKLDWVHRLIDIRPITHDLDRVVNYCLKNGVDAFLAEAAHIPA